MAFHGPGPIPQRWLHCPRKAESIILNRFLAFKTPLGKDFNKQLPMDCIFTPEMIFDYCKTMKLKLGLWIDLTNTRRFYDRTIVESRGAKYIKLQCRGHGETPSWRQTMSFSEICQEFIDQNPLDIIGVHCTHGFNRTGFLIATFLVDRYDFSMEAALQTFAAARPPGIYKQDYINELFARFDNIEDATLAPAMPSWSLEYDDSNGNDASPAASSSGSAQKRKADDEHTTADGQEVLEEGEQIEYDEELVAKRKKRRRETFLKDAKFMRGVSGVHHVTEQPRLGELQLKVQQMCNWSKNGFPGAQPVSMDQTNLKLLNKIPYRVSWKADGNRYMMLINKCEEIYFFDRNFSCFQVDNITFFKAGRNEHLEDTLLDGEMVLDKFKNTVTPRYLIYDILKISNQDIASKPFYPNRLNCIRSEIIEPRIEAMRKGLINRQLEPFGVRNKEFWDIRQSVSLLGEKFAQGLSHEPDGLIFQPSKMPYTAGVCPEVLKWKPLDMNSVDFRLKIAMESGPGLLPRKRGLLYVGGYERPFSEMRLYRSIRELDNKIIECTFNKVKNQWEFLRERTDKTLPNSYNTAQSVCESIRNPVTKDILLDFIANYGFRDDNDMMPPPSAAAAQNAHHQQQLHQQQRQQQEYQQHQEQQHQQQKQQEQQQDHI